MRLVHSPIFLGIVVLAASPSFSKAVTEADLRDHIEILASDAFEGRKPGTAG
jgi:hypothetical protein